MTYNYIKYLNILFVVFCIPFVTKSMLHYHGEPITDANLVPIMDKHFPLPEKLQSTVKKWEDSNPNLWDRLRTWRLKPSEFVAEHNDNKSEIAKAGLTNTYNFGSYGFAIGNNHHAIIAGPHHRVNNSLNDIRQPHSDVLFSQVENKEITKEQAIGILDTIVKDRTLHGPSRAAAFLVADQVGLDHQTDYVSYNKVYIAPFSKSKNPHLASDEDHVIIEQQTPGAALSNDPKQLSSIPLNAIKEIYHFGKKGLLWKDLEQNIVVLPDGKLHLKDLEQANAAGKKQFPLGFTGNKVRQDVYFVDFFLANMANKFQNNKEHHNVLRNMVIQDPDIKDLELGLGDRALAKFNLTK